MPSFGDEPSVLAPAFEPADVSTYGGDPEPNHGYFFQYDVLYWSITSPPLQAIGSNRVAHGSYGIDSITGQPYAGSQVSNMTTAGFNNEFTIGQRIEFGRMGENDDGFMVSIYQQRDEDQQLNFIMGNIVFNDPGHLLTGWIGTYTQTVGTVTTNVNVYAELPPIAEYVTARSTVDTWGVEANYMHRFETSHCGGTLEVFAGARYYEFNDNYDVYCNYSTSIYNYMAGSRWEYAAENHIVGPQVGLRWQTTRARWTFNTEGRFAAGFNSTNFLQHSLVGDGIRAAAAMFTPAYTSAVSASNSATQQAFSPMAELRVEAEYKITSTISLRAGWTGMWVGNVARADNVVVYNWGDMGINTNNCRNDIFVNGATLGLQINR
jgi:hypothetical protein